MSHQTAIRCENITVEYTSPTAANRSLKESVIGLIKGSYSADNYFNALKNVSFQVQQGECIGFIGPNGCGKSTLLKVIAGVITPQKGNVNTKGVIAPLIELGAGFDPELTGIENIWMSCALMGVPKKTIASKIDDIVSFAELGDFIHGPIKTYSSGMYMRLGFACATIIQPDILLIDEILAVGDARFQSKCLDLISEIQRRKKTIVIVSHDRQMIEKMCSRSVFLWHGQVRYEGECSTAFDIYDALSSQVCSDDDIDQIVKGVIQKKHAQKAAAVIPPENPEQQDDIENQDKPVQHEKLIEFLNVSAEVHENEGVRLLAINCQLTSLGKGKGPFNIGLEIRDELSRRIFTANTRSDILSGNLTKLRLDYNGTIQLKWIYEITPLASGNYIVDLAATDHEIITVYEVKPQAATFLVHNLSDTYNHNKNLVHLERKELSVF